MTTHIDSQQTDRQIPAPRVRNTLDLATVIGLLVAFALIAVAILLGGSPLAFVDLPAICIVIGGTFGVVTACYSIGEPGANSQRDNARFLPRIPTTLKPWDLPPPTIGFAVTLRSLISTLLPFERTPRNASEAMALNTVVKLCS